MNQEQIQKIAVHYKEILNKRGYLVPIRYNENEYASHDGRFTHLLWMCEELISGKVDGEKAHRWLGFIQGVFFDDGRFTIAQLKDHNR